MITDRARIFVQGGRGGDGCMSFRREAHVPKGGPDGGDGGHGGNVVIVADASLRDLAAFRRGRHFKAGRGGHGQGSQRHGADGDDLIVPVPCGTVVEDPEAGVRVDLVRPGQQTTVARGGSGGRGNRHFRSATRQAPRFAEQGLSGTESWLDLRLKLLADVGLIGLPNAGKSSLLGRLTRATPKVAEYPFTTLEPALGTLETEERQLILADIPGLIEGAGGGAGLGHEFLAHVERTRLLVHVIELGPLAVDAAEAYTVVGRELAAYSPALGERPRIVVLSKCDLVTPEEREAALAEWRGRLAGDERVLRARAAADWEDGAPGEPIVLATSAATGEGVEELAAAIARSVPAGEPEPDQAAVAGEEALAEHLVYRPGEDLGFQVTRAPEGFQVIGRGIERLVERTDLENEEALEHLERRLRELGVIERLEAEGFEPGDDVEIAGTVFELDPGR